jgi:hypothetical protein
MFAKCPSPALGVANSFKPDYRSPYFLPTDLILDKITWLEYIWLDNIMPIIFPEKILNQPN